MYVFLILSRDKSKNTHLALLRKVQRSRFPSTQTLPVSQSLFSSFWFCLKKQKDSAPDKGVQISKIQDFQVKIEEKSRENAVAQFPLVIQNY